MNLEAQYLAEYIVEANPGESQERLEMIADYIIKLGKSELLLREAETRLYEAQMAA